MVRDAIKRFVCGASDYPTFRRELTQWPYWEGDDCQDVEGLCADFEHGDLSETDLRSLLLDWIMMPRLALDETSTEQHAFVDVVYSRGHRQQEG